MLGESLRALENSIVIKRSLSPCHFDPIEPLVNMNILALHCVAIARAMWVLPVPGGYKNKALMNILSLEALDLLRITRRLSQAWRSLTVLENDFECRWCFAQSASHRPSPRYLQASQFQKSSLPCCLSSAQNIAHGPHPYSTCHTIAEAYKKKIFFNFVQPNIQAQIFTYRGTMPEACHLESKPFCKLQHGRALWDILDEPLQVPRSVLVTLKTIECCLVDGITFLAIYMKLLFR